MKILNILLVFAILATITMPTLAATGEENLKVIGADGKEKTDGISSHDDDAKDSDTTSAVKTEEGNITNSEGFNKLLSAPIQGVDYLLNMGPTEKLVLLIVGLAIGGSIVLTIISLAINNGRIGWGGIWGKWSTILNGRNWMAIVFLGFLGFLFALALMKYFATTSYF